MRIRLCIVCMLFLELSLQCYTPAAGQWQSLNGPPGGTIMDFVRLRGRALVASFEGGSTRRGMQETPGRSSTIPECTLPRCRSFGTAC
jgi:hypothetical protein